MLEKLGKSGSGPMEFSNPGRILWREEERLYYVMDSGNRRIQRLSSSFQYVDMIDLSLYDIYGQNLLTPSPWMHQAISILRILSPT